MSVRISADFVISLVLIFVANSFDYACLFIGAAALHEAGHLAFMKFYKIKKPELNLGLLGAHISADMSSLSYGQEAAVYLGGAIFNFIGCIVCLLAIRVEFDTRAIFFFFANLFYALLNLLPLKTLDGGRVLECCALVFFDDIRRADNLCRLVSFVLSVAVIILSTAFLVRCNGNVTLALLVVWIVFSAYSQIPVGAKLRKRQQRRRLTD